MNSNDSNMKARLRRAIINNSHKKLLELLRLGVDINTLVRTRSPYPGGPELRSLLMLAVKKSDVALIKILIENGSLVQMQVQNRTALEEAVQRGNAQILRLLLEHGADVNDRGDHGTAYLQVVDMAVNTYRIPSYDPEMDHVLREYGAKLVSMLSEARSQEALNALQKGYVVQCDICHEFLKREQIDQQWHLFCPTGCTDAYWPDALNSG